jgi:hypothetical protein
MRQPISPPEPNKRWEGSELEGGNMTRLRRIALTILVGVLVTLPTAGSALAGNVSVDGEVAAESAPLFFLDGRTLNPLEVNDSGLSVGD